MNQVHISSASWRSRSVVGLAVALVALTAACGDDDSKGSPATTASATTEPSATTSESTDGGDSDSEGATVLALMAEAGLEADLDAEQLACVDEVFDGVDLSEFEETFDPFGDYVSDDAMMRSGKMLDDCFESEDRIALVAASMVNAELGTAVQIACSAQQFDALVLAAGTFEDLLTMELDVTEQMFDAFEGCGIDMGGSDGGDDGSADPCEAEQRTIETAIEAYFADNGSDAESWDDLLALYLTEDPSERWELDFGPDGVPFVVGIGDCAGYGA